MLLSFIVVKAKAKGGKKREKRKIQEREKDIYSRI